MEGSAEHKRGYDGDGRHVDVRAPMAAFSLTAQVLDRRAAVGTVALLAVLGGLQLMPAGAGVQRASDLLQLALAALAALSAAAAARRGRGTARLFWTMVAASTTAWGIGQFLFTLERSALSPASASDLQRGLFVFSAFPLAVAGLTRPDRPGARPVLLVVDAALLAGLGLFVYFYVGAAFAPDERGFSAWRQVATLGQTLVVSVTLVPLAMLSSSVWAPTYRYVAAAGLLWFAGNALLSAAFFLNAYRAGLLDIPWSLPFVWLIAAASTWRPPTMDETVEAAEPWRDTRRALTLAMGAVGMVPTLHLATSLALPADVALWHTRTQMALVALIALGVLFALRQYLVVRSAEATERARTRELERIDARFHQAFSHSPAAMAIVRGNDLRVIDANARCCDLLDLPRTAIVGARTSDLLIRMPDAEHQGLEDVLRSGRTRGGLPVRFHTRAGAPIESLVSIEQIEVGGEPAALLVMEDIRERKGLEDQLVNAQKMDAIGRLAGGIAHEFNNLLTAIMNAGSLARAEIDRPDVVEGHLDRIDRASQRAALLTRQLLAFGRRQALRPELLDVAAVVDEMRTLLPSVLGEDVRLEVDAPAHLPRVRADRSQLKQVILNLAANARDAMPRGGRLSIALAEVAADGVTGHGTDVRLSVSDDGVGMSEQVQQHLFEPFFTTKDPGERGGMGLAAVYGIVAQSGGRILVESEPGRGTVVTILFPAMPGAEGGLTR
jgi:PAS domain S-box-containing protein